MCSGLSWKHSRSLGPEHSSRTLTIVPGLAPAGDGAQGASGKLVSVLGRQTGATAAEAGGRRQLQQGRVVAHSAQVPLRVFEDLRRTAGAGRARGGGAVGAQASGGGWGAEGVEGTQMGQNRPSGGVACDIFCTFSS